MSPNFRTGMESPADEPAMTLEQMKSNLFHKFQREGAVDQIRVQLRTSFVQTLQKASHAAAMAASTSQQEWTVVEKVANSMVCQYLQAKQLKHTLSVFLPEVGPRNCDLQHDMIQKLLRLPAVPTNDANASESSPLWLIDMLSDKERRAEVSSHDIQTQTVEDDHRFLLDTELKRIDDMYWSQSMLIKDQPQRSFHDQLVAYQNEYDARSQVQLQKEIERIREMEISMMRMEERKKHAKEMDGFRAALQAEFTAKAEGLADTEAQLRIEFADHRQQLDADMFELRQTLLRELDNVRSKERQLLSSIDLDAMKSANEARRLALIEDNLKQRERQLDQTLKAVEEEREGQLRRVMDEANAKVHAQATALEAMQRQLDKEAAQLRESQGEFTAMAQRVAVVEGQLAAARGMHMEQKVRLDQLERERASLEELLTASRATQVELATKEDTAVVALAHARDTITRLEREAKAERAFHATQVDDKSAALQDALAQVQAAQAELARLKVDHADAIVAVKHAAYDAIAAERQAAKRMEEAMHAQLHDLHARFCDVDAQCHRYRTQCEDEQVHVASLRHEISSLNALLNTFKYASPAPLHGGGPARRPPSWMASMEEAGDSRMMGRGRPDFDDDARQYDAWKHERGGRAHQRMMQPQTDTTLPPPAAPPTTAGHSNADDMAHAKKTEDDEMERLRLQKQLDDERDLAAVLEKQRQEREAAATRELELRLQEQAAARAAMEAQLKASQDAFDRQLQAQEKAKEDLIHRLRHEAEAKQAQDDLKRQNDAREMEARRVADAAAMQADMAARALEEKRVKDELARQLQEAQDQLSRQMAAAAAAQSVASQRPTQDGGADKPHALGDASSQSAELEHVATRQARVEEERKLQHERSMELAKVRQEQLERDQLQAKLREQERVDAAARAEALAREQTRLDEEKRQAAEAAATSAEEARQEAALAARQKLLDDERRANEEAFANQQRLEKEVRAKAQQEQELAEAKQRAEEDQQREKEAKQREDEAKQHEDEAKQREAEAKQREDEAKQREVEDKQREEEAAKKQALEAELEAARLKQEAESKEEQEQKKDANIIDEYRQRALARRAEKLRLEQEAKAKEEAKEKEEAERRQREEAAAAAAAEDVASESGDSVLSVGGVEDDNSGDGSADAF